MAVLIVRSGGMMWPEEYVPSEESLGAQGGLAE